MQPLDPNESALVQRVIDVCESAIKQAVAQPSRAVGLVKGFGAALTSLQLIQSEVAEGGAGPAVITGNADALTRNALAEILGGVSQPDDALAALAAVSDVAPPAPSSPTSCIGCRTDAFGHSSLPLFSEISQAYIDMKASASK